MVKSYRGQRYNGCTDFDRDEPWCATKVDEIGDMLEWDYCRGTCQQNTEVTCLTDSGQSCQFPFHYAGRFYSACTDRDSHPGYYWCPSKLAEDRGFIEGEWGFCTEGCKVSNGIDIPSDLGNNVLGNQAFLEIELYYIQLDAMSLER